MRQIVVPIMIVAGLIAGVGAVFAIYFLDTVVDSDEFAKRTADALSEPEVGKLIVEKVVDQIVEAKPNTLAARPLLEQVVSRVVSGQAFRTIYGAAIRDVHRTIFRGETNTVSVRLTDMVLIVRTQAAVLSPQLADEIPDDLTDTLIDVQGYVGEADPKDPLVSPVFGDYTGMTPMFLLAGTAESSRSATIAPERCCPGTSPCHPC